jgi:hypothetical protein
VHGGAEPPEESGRIGVAARRGEAARRSGNNGMPALAFGRHILLRDHYDEPRSGVSICLVNALAQQNRHEYRRTVPNSRNRVPVPRLQNEMNDSCGTSEVHGENHCRDAR